MSAVETRDPGELWDGKLWVERPADFVDGVFRPTGFQARNLLKLGAGKLTNWEAEVCQRAMYAKRPTGTVSRWVDVIADRLLERMAA